MHTYFLYKIKPFCFIQITYVKLNIMALPEKQVNLCWTYSQLMPKPVWQDLPNTCNSFQTSLSEIVNANKTKQKHNCTYFVWNRGNGRLYHIIQFGVSILLHFAPAIWPRLLQVATKNMTF